MTPASRPWQGTRVLVTGASSGIGRAVAERLAAGGAHLALAGRDHAALEQVAAAVAEHRATAVTVSADLAGRGEPERVVHLAVESLGGLDTVVSNAGAGWAGSFPSMSAGDLDRLLDVNLRAPLQLTRAALPHLEAAGGGRLVFVGSIAGLVGVPGEAAYSAAKAGLTGLADALRGELAARGITVTLAAPGVVDTAFFARRNRPYQRRWPPPLPVGPVAEAIVAAAAAGRPEVIVPRWLALPARLHGGLPSLYRRLARLA